MTITEKKELAKVLVNNFIRKFQEAIGTKPIIKYSIELDAATINEVFNVVNNHFKIAMCDDSVSICDDRRLPEYVKHRNVFFSICRDFGYSSTLIGSVVNKDHVTVLYGAKNVSETSELKKEINNILKNINTLNP